MYQRIISLVPSQTELLFDLGLKNHIIGVTKYCIYPPEAQLKMSVGGTKTLDINGILALKPDLILGNIEENQQTQIETLRLAQNVVMSDIYTLDDALKMIQDVGSLTNTTEKAAVMCAAIQAKFAKLHEKSSFINSILSVKKPKVAYFIWRKPYMVAAKNTFIDDMLTQMGCENAFADRTRYPEITVADLENTEIDCIFLSSEPFPFKEKHIAELQKIKPLAQVKIVDGEMFSWYGSRLLQAPAYFESLLIDQVTNQPI